MAKYDLYWVNFKFEDDPTKSKRRPCLILDGNKVITITKITSHSPRTKYDVELLDWKKEGLPKASTVRLNKLRRISNKELQGYIGHLTNKDIQRIEQVLSGKLNSSLGEEYDEVDEDLIRKTNISKIPLTTFKQLAFTSNRATPQQAKDFKFATNVDTMADILSETDKAYLLNIGYYVWNKERTGKDKRFILIWYPKSTLRNNGYVKVRENKGINPKIKSRGIRESLEGSEYFTKEEIKTLPKELAQYFQEQSIPKYYDISVEDMGDKKYVLRGNIDYGDLSHDHRYFDTKAKEFFSDKGIQVDIYEPDNLKDNDEGDGIYSSAHIIQKSGNRVYVPQENELDNFID